MATTAIKHPAVSQYTSNSFPSTIRNGAMSSPRAYQHPQWRPEAQITPRQFINNHQYHYSYPSFVTPFTIHNPSYPYYHQGHSGSPCNISPYYNRFNMPDQRDAVEATERPAKRSKVAEKKQQAKSSPPGKGLRHFSMKICERVKGMGTTSYNEVADELIKELREDEAKALQASGESSTTASSKKDTTNKKKKGKSHQSKYDEKNIRRRVYDALNVLMAMEIIVKDKKQIVWNGFPGQRTIKTANSGAVDAGNKMSDNDSKEPSKELLKLREERERRREELHRKREILQELLTQNVCFNNLYQRNHAREVALMTTQQNQVGHANNDTEKIPLPFIVVYTNHQAVIHCEMCPQKTNVSFDFTMPFEINDDNEILKRIGMDRTTHEEFQRMVPPDLYHYCYSQGMLENVVHPMIYGCAR